MTGSQIKAGTRVALTQKLHFDGQANGTVVYNGVTFEAPITIQSTAFNLSIALGFADTWFSCNNFAELGCKETCPTSYPSEKDGCVVTANATLLSADGTVVAKDFKAGFAQGRYADGIAKEGVVSLGTDGVLGLGPNSYMPEGKKRRDRLLDAADSFSLSLASDNAFVMFNGVDDALIAKKKLSAITLLLVRPYTWRLDMTAFQVSGLPNSTAALFPCLTNSLYSMSDICESRMTTGFTYITMPNWIFTAFEEKYLKPTCEKTLQVKQEISGNSNMYVCPREVDLPQLALTFGNATFYMEKEDYVTPMPEDPSKVVVELLGDSDWNLGTAFLSKLYIQYHELANITVYCQDGDDCALNVVTNPPPVSASLYDWTGHDSDNARVYFGMNTTAAAPSYKSTYSPYTPFEPYAPIPPSDQTHYYVSTSSTKVVRNVFVIIICIISSVLSVIAAAQRHEKRKQQDAAAAAAAAGLTPGKGNDADIATPVQNGEAAPYQAAPYQAAPYQAAPYQAAPYQAAPYQTGAYQAAPYQAAPYHQAETTTCRT